MIRVIFNQKGGVGKTSIACNLAAVSAVRGNRTLLVDLDPQGNSTDYVMGHPAEKFKDNAANFFEQTLSFNLFHKDPDSFTHQSPYKNLFVLPSNPELEYLERKLEAKHKIYKLKNALRELESQFDEIIIDTAPVFNFYTLSALIAADKVLIPFDCDDFSRQALYQVMGEIQDIQEDHNNILEVEGIIVNQFQPRATLPTKLVAELIEEGLPVLSVKLNASIKMKESHQSKTPMIYFAPKHALTFQFENLFRLLSGESIAEDAVTAEA